MKFIGMLISHFGVCHTTHETYNILYMEGWYSSVYNQKTVPVARWGISPPLPSCMQDV